MQNITTAAGLKNAIQLLEAEHSFKGEQLKEQFHITFESLKPVNLLKNSLKDVATSPHLIEDILSTAIGMATGYITKKIVVGATGGIARNLLGSLLQFGVTKLVSQHPETIKSIGRFIVQNIFRKKE